MRHVFLRKNLTPSLFFHKKLLFTLFLPAAMKEISGRTGPTGCDLVVPGMNYI